MAEQEAEFAYCSRCKTTKLVGMFGQLHNGRPTKTADRITYWCKKCKHAANDRYRKANSEKIRAAARPTEAKWRDRRRKPLRNMPCEICAKPETARNTVDIAKGPKALAKDHDHANNLSRGYLCHNCNSMLGYAKDNINTLYKGVEYIIKWRTIHRNLLARGD